MRSAQIAAEVVKGAVTAMPDADLFGCPEPAHDPGGRRLPLPPGVSASAIYGGPLDCYRYLLDWTWGDGPTLMALGMNPSTAGHMNGDATICKLHRMAVRRGFGCLLMANVHAYRATDQARLAEVDDPIGPMNQMHVYEMAARADVILACYGRPKVRKLQENGPKLCRWLHRHYRKLHALKVSADGTPWHPLYIKEDTPFAEWAPDV